MKRRALWLALLVALAVLAVQPVLWAAPGQNPERQTVPTRTPAPGPISPPTNTPVLSTNPPPATQPAPTSAAPTATSTSLPASTATAAATAVSAFSTATPEGLPATGPTGEATLTPAAAATPPPTVEAEASPEVTETPAPVTALPTLSATPSSGGERSSAPSPASTVQAEPARGLGGVSYLFCAGVALILLGLILLLLWRRRA